MGLGRKMVYLVKTQIIYEDIGMIWLTCLFNSETVS